MVKDNGHDVLNAGRNWDPREGIIELRLERKGAEKVRVQAVESSYPIDFVNKEMLSIGLELFSGCSEFLC